MMCDVRCVMYDAYDVFMLRRYASSNKEQRNKGTDGVVKEQV